MRQDLSLDCAESLLQQITLNPRILKLLLTYKRRSVNGLI